MARKKKTTPREKLEAWVEAQLAEEVSAYAPHDWPRKLIESAEDRGWEVEANDASLDDLREAISRLGWEAKEE